MTQLRRAEKRYGLTTEEYARLAGFRLAVRRFLRFSEAAAVKVGLSGQHYQAMLALRAWNGEGPFTIADLARQLLIKHNSAVELVDRLVAEDLLSREHSSADRRKVELRLTPRGRKLLARLAAVHRAELQKIGPVIYRLLGELTDKAD